MITITCKKKLQRLRNARQVGWFRRSAEYFSPNDMNHQATAYRYADGLVEFWDRKWDGGGRLLKLQVPDHYVWPLPLDPEDDTDYGWFVKTDDPHDIFLDGLDNDDNDDDFYDDAPLDDDLD